MSQEKVDRYKEQKANRKAIMRKKKIEVIMLRLAALLLLAAVCFWLGHSAYQKKEAAKERVEVTADVTALTDYMSNMPSQDDAEASEDAAGEQKTEDAAADSTGEEQTTEEASEDAAQ